MELAEIARINKFITRIRTACRARSPEFDGRHTCANLVDCIYPDGVNPVYRLRGGFNNLSRVLEFYAKDKEDLEFLVSSGAIDKKTPEELSGTYGIRPEEYKPVAEEYVSIQNEWIRLNRISQKLKRFSSRIVRFLFRKRPEDVNTPLAVLQERIDNIGEAVENYPDVIRYIRISDGFYIKLKDKVHRYSDVVFQPFKSETLGNVIRACYVEITLGGSLGGGYNESETGPRLFHKTVPNEKIEIKLEVPQLSGLSQYLTDHEKIAGILRERFSQSIRNYFLHNFFQPVSLDFPDNFYKADFEFVSLNKLRDERREVGTTTVMAENHPFGVGCGPYSEYSFEANLEMHLVEVEGNFRFRISRLNSYDRFCHRGRGISENGLTTEFDLDNDIKLVTNN